MKDNGDKEIHELIAESRANGYDAELEAVLANVWECPHCKHRTTIQGVLINIKHPELDEACPKCMRQGISPIDTGSPELSVHQGGKS